VKKYQFSKYSASGNDFVLIDNRFYQWNPSIEEIKKLCSRRTGIGADGLVLVNHSEKATIKMSIFNADGSEAEMCGNAARSVTHFCHERLAIQQNAQYFIETMNGIYQGHYTEDSVKVKMTELHDLGAVDLSDLTFDKSLYLNTGVPHSVLMVDDVDNLDIMGLGRRLRLDDRFKNGTNVDFFQVINEKEQRIKLRVYERGVEAETLCCGTGVMATAIACHHFFGWVGEVKVETLGGNLTASIDKSMQELYFAGPVSFVFDGEFRV
jgi:diaminopimelate epimerase